MIKDEKRELWKAHKHLSELLQIIYHLQDESMSPKKYYETMERLRKHAYCAADRVGKMIGREIDIFERMEFDAEPTKQPLEGEG